MTSARGVPAAGWRCPECGRKFVRKTREHSCEITSLDVHLEKTAPEVRAAFAAVRRLLDRIGPHEVIPLKTMVTLSAASSFGGVRFLKKEMELGFILTRALDHPRVRSKLELSPRTVAHHVRLSTPAEVDAELGAWLREAYQVGLARGRR